MPTNHELTTAYRHLYRWGLRAIQYSAPARFVLKARIRQAFREGNRSDFDHAKIGNTLEFLRGATASNGTEHHVLRNLMLCWYWEKDFWRQYRRSALQHVSFSTSMGAQLKYQSLTCHGRDHNASDYRTGSYNAFDHTIRMLNSTMNMCLPYGNGHMLPRYAKITSKGRQAYPRPSTASWRPT